MNQIPSLNDIQIFQTFGFFALIILALQVFLSAKVLKNIKKCFSLFLEENISNFSENLIEIINSIFNSKSIQICLFLLLLQFSFFFLILIYLITNKIIFIYKN